MDIEFKCLKCGQTMETEELYAGRVVQCPHCGKGVVVPRGNPQRMTVAVEFKCPQCGQMVEADESYVGQVVRCPHCKKGIVVPRGKIKLGIRQDVESLEKKEVSETLPREYAVSSELQEHHSSNTGAQQRI